MREITLSMHEWSIEDKTPYINIGKAGENNAVTIFLQGDDLIYTDETEDRYVEYFLDICDENDVLSANTQKFTESQDGQGNVIFSMSIMREFLGKEGIKLLQVRCVITNSNNQEINTYESNVFHAIVGRNSGFCYKYDLAYFRQMMNTVENIIKPLSAKTIEFLSKVEISDLQDGQVLIYDESIDKWINKTI